MKTNLSPTTKSITNFVIRSSLKQLLEFIYEQV